jgi:hypothetical protein
MGGEMRALFLGLVLALCTVTVAQAATMRAVYAGIVGSGDDPLRFFGPTGPGSLVGLAAELMFVYDTSLGARSSSGPDESPAFDALAGGYGDIETPFLSASVTVGGVTRTLPGTVAGEVIYREIGTSWRYEHFAVAGGDGNDYRLTAELTAPNVPPFAPTASLDAPFALEVGLEPLLEYYLFFSFSETAAPFNTLASASIDFRELRIERVGAIPVPATGWLLVGGLGVLAAAGRRRRGA